jgi:hypothetical protein
VYICISLNRGQHSSTHLYISLLQGNRPPFTPVQQTGEGKQRMCLSCSSDAVPCDTLVGMLFFQLPLGAWNNLAVPLTPALSLSADTATWLAFAMTTKTTLQVRVLFTHCTSSRPLSAHAQIRPKFHVLGLTQRQLSQAGGNHPKASLDVSESKASSPQWEIPTSITPPKT